MRRLPVYLLLDVSGSMYGEPIQSVQTGMETLRNALRKDPYALESAYVSVITFASEVNQIVPLTEVASFVPPQLSAGGGTSLGGVLQKVKECAEAEVQKTTAEQKGDWKPLVFLMTDGVPTDNLASGLAEFKKYKWGVVVACAAGDGADVTTLQSITETVVKLETTGSDEMAAFFKWVSASIATGSRRADEGAGTSADELPPPPPEITLIQP